MARREVLILSDDLDGTESDDVETVYFGFDGADYEIDLSEKNRDKLEKALTPFLNSARKASMKAGRGVSRKAGAPHLNFKASPEDREYLRKNGFPNIKDRGRLPNDAVAALRNR